MEVPAESLNPAILRTCGDSAGTAARAAAGPLRRL